MMDVWNSSNKTKKQIEIDNRLYDYDFCATTLDAYSKLKPKLNYLGESKIYFINGVKQVSDKVLHFWEYKI